MAPPEEIRAPESGTFTIGEPGERNSVVEETRSPEPTEVLTILGRLVTIPNLKFFRGPIM